MTDEPQSALTKALDDAEPRAERTNVSIALIVGFALLVYWGMLYLDNHGGGFNPKVYEPYGSYALLDAAQPPGDPNIDLPKKGKIVFEANCAACHQVTGVGSPANGCPPLVGSDWATAEGPNRIVRLVLYGGQGPINVLGQQYPGTTPMTPFKDTLNDEQIAQALSYVRNAWGNKASVVLPEKVTQIRAKEAAAGFTGYRNATELLKIPVKD
jgi:mono/diheme cytochrome c family protein